MWKGGIFLVFLAVLCLTAKESAAVPDNDLFCFQCDNQSQDECADMKNLKKCPNDQAYDTCQTTIIKIAGRHNTTVSKECALGPCYLESLGMSKECDMSGESFHCVLCCRGTACNGADHNVVIGHVVITAAAVVTLAFHTMMVV